LPPQSVDPTMAAGGGTNTADPGGCRKAMMYVINVVTPADLDRAVRNIPKRILDRFPAVEIMRRNMLPAGYNVIFSPWDNSFGCTMLGNFPSEEEARRYARECNPKDLEDEALPAPGPRIIRKESGRPLKYVSSADTFMLDRCDRCGQVMFYSPSISWFGLDMLCTECESAEADLKERIRRIGIADAMEGCGYVPEIVEGKVGVPVAIGRTAHGGVCVAG